jgi:O-antigen ligase
MLRIRTKTYERFLCAALLFALLFGSADFDSPQYGAVLRVMIAAIVAFEVPRLRFDQMVWGEKALLALAGGLCGLMLLQLVPLPPAVWMALPGHGVARDVYVAAGWQDHWHALNLAPDEGITALIKVILPIGGFLAVTRLTIDQRTIALRIIVCVAVASAVFGVVQFASGPGAPVLWVTEHQGSGVGFFVDRNHQGLFLEIAIVLAGLPGVMRRDSRGHGGVPFGGLYMVIAVWALLSAGVLATTSRLSVVLLPPTVAGAIAISSQLRGNTKRTLQIAGGLLLLGGALMFTPIMQEILARYAKLADNMRYVLWQNSWELVKASFPLGLGFGSFVNSYLTIEPLDQVQSLFVNHAHNEYLEWPLEGGIPALLLLLGALAVLVSALIDGIRQRSGSRRQMMVLAAGLSIILALIHSADEFPLRTPSLAVLFGMLAALLFRAPETRRSISETPRGGRGLAIGTAVIAAIVALFSISSAVAVWGSAHNNFELAVDAAPWASDGWQNVAFDRYAANDHAGAEAAAENALAIQPLDGAAVRMLAGVRMGRQQSSAALGLLAEAGHLGWRDSAAQLALVDTAVGRGDAADAARHVDAIAREDVTDPRLWAGFDRLMVLRGGADALAGRMRLNAPWIRSFLDSYPVQPGASPQRFEDIVSAMQRHGIAASHQDVQVGALLLAENGSFAKAAKLLSLTSDHSLLYDPGFEATASGPLRAGYAPGIWYASDSSPFTQAVQVPDRPWSGQAVVVGSRGMLAGRAFLQLLLLPTGTYHLTARVSSTDRTPPDVSEWQFVCRQSDQSSDPIVLPVTWRPVRDGWWEASGDFTVADSCPAQELTFALTAVHGVPLQVAVDDVTLRQISQSSTP